MLAYCRRFIFLSFFENTNDLPFPRSNIYLSFCKIHLALLLFSHLPLFYILVLCPVTSLCCYTTSSPICHCLSFPSCWYTLQIFLQSQQLLETTIKVPHHFFDGLAIFSPRYRRELKPKYNLKNLASILYTVKNFPSIVFWSRFTWSTFKDKLRATHCIAFH